MSSIFGTQSDINSFFKPLKRGEPVSIEEMRDAELDFKNTRPPTKMKKTISWPTNLVASVHETWSALDYDRTKIEVDYTYLIVKQKPFDMFGECEFSEYQINDECVSSLAGVSISSSLSNNDTDTTIFKPTPVRRTKSHISGLSSFDLNDNYF